MKIQVNPIPKSWMASTAPYWYHLYYQSRENVWPLLSTIFQIPPDQGIQELLYHVRDQLGKDTNITHYANDIAFNPLIFFRIDQYKHLFGKLWKEFKYPSRARQQGASPRWWWGARCYCHKKFEGWCWFSWWEYVQHLFYHSTECSPRSSEDQNQ